MKKITSIAYYIYIASCFIIIGFFIFCTIDYLIELDKKCYTVNYTDFEEQFIDEALSNIKNFRIYDSDNLTAEILENRANDDVIIVERCIGVVTNANCVGDGQILNTDDSYYNYISYRCIDGIEKGNIILTYLIYNPNNGYIDDIIKRYDYIIK